MDSRERIKRAINHQAPDRVPIDLGSTIVSGIAATKYHELKQELTIKAHPTRIYDVYLMLAQPHLELLEQLHVDTVMLPWLMRRDRWGIRLDAWREWEHPTGMKMEVPANFRPRHEAEGDLVMEQNGEVFARMPAGGFYFDYIESVRAVGDNLPDTESARYALLTEEELTFIETTSRTLYENTDKALVGDGGGTDLDILGSYDEWLMLLATEPEYMTEFYQKRVESVIANLERYA
jgi:uroporphyrinogen decarboxylase